MPKEQREQLPKWIRKKLNTDGAKRISEAVARAEAKTSAEIVPMVVSGSITTGHVPWILFLIALPVIWMLIPYMMHDWLGEVATVVGAVIFAAVFHRFNWVKRILTPNADETVSVNRRALLEFHLANLRSTQNGTGVLIFVSMLERKAVVLADDRIAAEFPPEICGETLNVLTSRIKQRKFADGMSEAIDLLGEKLATKFPAASSNPNELPNTLIVKD